jgi:2-polyprenyl-3-methyl-5-hydroxy-6-metoxy-1,4-benzoquinol methylase
MGCREDDVRWLEGFDRLHGLPGRFSVVRCRVCGLLRTDPRPTRQSISDYYPPEYGPHSNAAVISSAEWPAWKHALARFFQFNNERLPPPAPGRFLEVGAATGNALLRMAAKGWSVEGIESSDAAASIARQRGLNVRTGTIEEAPDPDSPFDVIVVTMVLEHLHDPIAALQKLRRWTRPGGLIVVTVPNAASLNARLFRSYWFDLDLPRHLFHFTPRTLTNCLERAGWRRDRIFHHRLVGSYVASVGYLLRTLGVRGVANRLIGFPESTRGQFFLFPIAFLLAAIGQSGRMTVWARRSDG